MALLCREGGVVQSFALGERPRVAIVSALTERRLLRHALAVAERGGGGEEEGESTSTSTSLRFLLGDELASAGLWELAVDEWVRCVRHVSPDAVTSRLTGPGNVHLCAAYVEACAAALDEADRPGGRPAGVLGRYARLVREYLPVCLDVAAVSGDVPRLDAHVARLLAGGDARRARAGARQLVARGCLDHAQTLASAFGLDAEALAVLRARGDAAGALAFVADRGRADLAAPYVRWLVEAAPAEEAAAALAACCTDDDDDDGGGGGGGGAAALATLLGSLSAAGPGALPALAALLRRVRRARAGTSSAAVDHTLLDVLLALGAEDEAVQLLQDRGSCVDAPRAVLAAAQRGRLKALHAALERQGLARALVGLHARSGSGNAPGAILAVARRMAPGPSDPSPPWSPTLSPYEAADCWCDALRALARLGAVAQLREAVDHALSSRALDPLRALDALARHPGVVLGLVKPALVRWLEREAALAQGLEGEAAARASAAHATADPRRPQPPTPQPHLGAHAGAELRAALDAAADPVDALASAIRQTGLG